VTRLIPQEHFKPYVPNPNTKLGRAYLYAVKDCEGPLLATEASFLRDNPLLWLRAISLYSNNLDFLIKLTKTRLKAQAPVPGPTQAVEAPAYTQAVRDHGKWSVVQEHKLQKIRARRAELIIELGYEDIKQAMVTGDMVGALNDILTALQQEDHVEAGRLAEHWIFRLTGNRVDTSDPEPAEAEDLDVLASLMAKIGMIPGEGE